LVNRNGRVLHEQLEAFRAPDKPKILSFHGHGLASSPPQYLDYRKLDCTSVIRRQHQPPVDTIINSTSVIFNFLASLNKSYFCESYHTRYYYI
jgi:hypothetical protein